MPWLVLTYSLPAQAVSSPRVTLWRRLRRLGAISPAGGAQLLPARDECREAFQWLAQEIRHAGGDALVMRVEGFEGLTDAEVIQMFNTSRSEEYADLASQLDQLEQAAAKEAGEGDTTVQDQLDKLKRRLAEIQRVDYFESATGQRLAGRLASFQQRLRHKPRQDAPVPSLQRTDYLGRAWVTRPRPHVDRLACAWLIRRYIDPSARIRYRVTPEPSEVTFDMDSGLFSHVGSLCTFEVMLAAFGLGDPGLHRLAEIVHEVDLQDDLYHRPEIAGLEAILKGWRSTTMSDLELEQAGLSLFDGLYRALRGQDEETAP